MLFGRREREELRQRLRVMLWPRRSFMRSARYFAKRVLRLQATPHAIGAGVAAGVFASFLPLPGFHFILAALVAWICAGNLVASAIGTAFGNPLTFPLIWGASFELGRFLLHGREIDGIEPLQVGSVLRHLRFGELWEPLMKPMFAGALPLGLLFGLAFYLLTRWGVAAFHERRRRRLLTRSAKADAAAPPTPVRP